MRHGEHRAGLGDTPLRLQGTGLGGGAAGTNGTTPTTGRKNAARRQTGRHEIRLTLMAVLSHVGDMSNMLVVTKPSKTSASMTFVNRSATKAGVCIHPMGHRPDRSMPPSHTDIARNSDTL